MRNSQGDGYEVADVFRKHLKDYKQGHRLSEATCLAEQKDGGVILAGDYSIIKFDQHGEFLWEKAFSSHLPFESVQVNDMCPSRDGNFYLTGEAVVDYETLFGDVLLVKVTPQGDTIWTRHYGVKNTEWAEDISVMEDGGIKLWGYNQARPPLYNLQGILIQTDENGELITDIESVRPQTEPTLLVMPNPASEEITVILPPESHGRLPWKIFTMQGRIVMNGEFQSNAPFQISVSGIMPGIYILQVDGNSACKFAVVK